MSAGFLLLQSTTCWWTNEPLSRWARGVAFCADNEARVQIAPSGMMKRRNDGFSIFELLFSLVCSALVMVVVTSVFFRPMSPIVSFVSWGHARHHKIAGGILPSNSQ